jgi:type I restriction enzyme S subunit
MSQKVPEGWTTSTLGVVCEIGGGVGFPEGYQGRTDLPHPFIKVSDMNAVGNETSIIIAKNYVNDETLRALNAKLFDKGSIVLPKVGAAALTNKRRRLTRMTAVDNNIMVWQLAIHQFLTGRG